jgi:hypothetical protein
MKKTTKRILALLMTVTALLGLMVPAVSAEETTASELETVVYNFDGDTIFAAIAKNTTNKVTPAPTNGTTYYGFAGNKDLPAAISEAYKAGNINWEIGVHNGLLIANNATYLRTDAFKGIRFCMQNDANGDPVNTRVGRWVSIPITAPSAGTYNFEIKHGIRNEGIDEVGFYVISYNTDAMTQAGVQALIDEVVAGREAEGIKKVGTYSCIGGTTTEEVRTDSLSGSYTFNSDDKYMIVLRADASDATGDKYIYVSNITMTPSVAQVGDTSYTDAGEAIAAIAAADANTKVEITGKLQLSADLSTAAAITVNEGAELDLNGKTLTATVNANGIVTDSGNGAGAIIGTSAVKNVGTNELALYDGSTCRIFDYTLTKGTGAGTADYDEKTDNGTKSVTFWYTFKFTNSAAYDMAMADGNGKLTVRAALAVGTASKNVELPAAAVAGWANKMKTEPDAGYAFYVTVTGFESLDPSVTGNLEVKLTVSGAAGTAVSDAASYTIG